MATFTSASYEGRYLQLTITETVSVVANTSTLSWTLTSAGGSAVYYTVDATTVTINGTTVYEKQGQTGRIESFLPRRVPSAERLRSPITAMAQKLSM